MKDPTVIVVFSTAALILLVAAFAAGLHAGIAYDGVGPVADIVDEQTVVCRCRP